MYRVVLDSGVLIAALLAPTGAPAGIVRAWRSGDLELIVSSTLLAELQRVLMRPKFRRYASEEEALEYVEVFRRLAILTSDPEPLPGLTPDPGDDYLVALARTTGADFLISGDSDLTGLVHPQPPVLIPRAFLDLLQTRMQKS